jgi:hypothetical protein
MFQGLSGGLIGLPGFMLIEMKNMNSFTIEGAKVRAQAGASVPELIRQCEKEGFYFPVQPASACRKTDVYDYCGVSVVSIVIDNLVLVNLVFAIINRALLELAELLQPMRLVL